MKRLFLVIILFAVLLSCFSFPVLASDVAGTVATDPVTAPDASNPDQTTLVETSSTENVELLQQLVELQALESGILLFLIVVVLFYFGYKFFRLFF